MAPRSTVETARVMPSTLPLGVRLGLDPLNLILAIPPVERGAVVGKGLPRRKRGASFTADVPA